MDHPPINVVSDPRIEHKTALLNGHTYHYLHGLPPRGQNYKATVFLIHGWPDLSMGWRYQIPFLLEMGCRVVAPDLMGFGGTDAPRVPPNPIILYGIKRAADDIAELAKQLGASKIVLGGHDWGGAVVWRTAQWYPQLVTHVFSVCTPYSPPHKEYYALEDLVKGPLPQFGYQLHLASSEVEAAVDSKEKITQFLKGMYGGRGPNGEVVFDPRKGVLIENLPNVGRCPLFNDEELEYYAEQYSRSGMHGTLNWYRTREINWEEDQELLDRKEIKIPTLFIQANTDSVLKPEMSRKMDEYLKNLTRGEVDASHWALTQKAAEVNAIIRQWLEKVGFGTRSSL